MRIHRAAAVWAFAVWAFAVWAFVAALIGGASNSQAASEVFTVRGVSVDVTAQTAAQARDEALLQGQVEAFNRLLARILPREAMIRVPPLEPGQVLDYVSDFAVDNERTSDVRYLADLTVRFNDQSLRSFLAANDLAHAETLSKPVVVLPVFGPADTARLWEEGNPWWAAWAARLPAGGLVPLIVPLGDLGDIAATNASQALSGDMESLNRLAGRYGAENMLVTQAIQIGDPELGPVSLQIGTSRLGQRQQGTTIETFVQLEDEDLPGLYARAAEAVADNVQEDWKQRNLLRPGLARKITVAVPLSGMDNWLKIKRSLNRVAGVQRSDIVTLSRTRGELDISFVGDEQQLVLAMAQSDLDLQYNEAEGWLLRVAGAAPPVPAAPASE
jgi:hypothetical protein